MAEIISCSISSQDDCSTLVILRGCIVKNFELSPRLAHLDGNILSDGTCGRIDYLLTSDLWPLACALSPVAF